MKLRSFTQINILDNDICFDAFIASTGYESRASFLAQKKIRSKRKFVIAFEDNYENENRLKNDMIFKENEFKFINTNG